MQLNFDLQSAPEGKPEPLMLTVTALTRRIRGLLESDIGEVWVEGEVSNFRRQNSGHIYFTLKDSTAQLACVLFSSQATQIRNLKIADGAQVQVLGQVTVYESRGQYQIIVRNVKPQGTGALQAKFQELKDRLAGEGLFDSSRKRPLPAFPTCIGVVTSPTGAAIRDFLHVLHRRQKGISVVIHPVRVQGRGAAQEIAQAIRDFGNPRLQGIPLVDVIVLARGGGSLEDLWEFNEEIVARTIGSSPIPVVSAVGHEIDFTIADFVADLRAPTPSAAAEILSADSLELLDRVGHLRERLKRCLRAKLESISAWLSHIKRSALFLFPVHSIRELQQTFDRARNDLDCAVLEEINKRRRFFERTAHTIERHNPQRHVTETFTALRTFLTDMQRTLSLRKTKIQSDLDKALAILHALNPKTALARGYTFTTSESGQAISTATNVRDGDILLTHFHDGKVRSVVKAPPH